MAVTFFALVFAGCVAPSGSGSNSEARGVASDETGNDTSAGQDSTRDSAPVADSVADSGPSPDTAADTGATDTDNDTAAEPDGCSHDAAASKGLQVILTWDSDLADLDLHLMEGAAALFAVPADCDWCNSNPDWGVAGEPSDNPTLDVDDIFGFGPECSSIPSAAPGTYTVAVHYFTDHGAEDVAAQVEIWSTGVLVSTEALTMSRDQEWQVGTVEFPGPTFTAIGLAAQASARGCD